MRILIVSSIDESAVARLREGHDVVCAVNPKEEDLKQLVGDREALVFRSGVSLSSEVLESAPNLRVLIRAGCGLDNLDLDCVRRRGIQIFRIPGPGAQAVAEMAVTLMLALARNLREADRLLRQGRWAKNELKGYLLAGKVLGIVGAGNIGTRVGQLGAALGMRPIGCVEHPSPTRAADFLEHGIVLASFEEVLSQADFVSIHVPLKKSTRNLIDSRALSRMKLGAFLINLARGGVVDEAALARELVNGGRLRGAALDVHEQEGEGKISPFASLPNVLLTPHIGAMTIDTQREIGCRIVEIVSSLCADGSASEEESLPVARTSERYA
jgi:phosphoglycerate dehydrogenase-like enzyme